MIRIDKLHSGYTLGVSDRGEEKMETMQKFLDVYSIVEPRRSRMFQHGGEY